MTYAELESYFNVIIAITITVMALIPVVGIAWIVWVMVRDRR